MNWLPKAALLLVLPLPALAAEPEMGAALDKLTASVDRLAGLLEKDAAARAGERDGRRVEVAVAILGVRYRKIDRLEDEIRQNEREEEDLTQGIELTKSQRDEFAKLAQSESGDQSQTDRTRLAMVDAQIKSTEDRIAKLHERTGSLQADVAAEKRRVASIEALVEDWMGKQ